MLLWEASFCWGQNNWDPIWVGRGAWGTAENFQTLSLLIFLEIYDLRIHFSLFPIYPNPFRSFAWATSSTKTEGRFEMSGREKSSICLWLLFLFPRCPTSGHFETLLSCRVRALLLFRSKCGCQCIPHNIAVQQQNCSPSEAGKLCTNHWKNPKSEG